jgi:hypothetical protein
MKYMLPFALWAYAAVAGAQPVTMFEPTTISDNGVFGFTLSPDGNTALWVQSQGKRDTLRLLESQRRKGQWQTPTFVPFTARKGEWKDIDPIFTPDGTVVLFQSNRPVPGHDARIGFDMWAVEKFERGWGTPYHLGNMINTDSSESYASMAKNGNLYFTGSSDKQQGDIYVATYRDGAYTAPQRLGPPINTRDKREANPFIAPDESYLIYAAGKPDNDNDSDLYIAFRKDGAWTAPINLGVSINSTISEFCPFVHTGQDRLYFARLERGPARNTENIFYVDHFSRILASLKKKP